MARRLRRLHHALGHHARAAAYGRDRPRHARQPAFLDLAQRIELLGIDHRREARERDRAAGVAGAATARDNGESELDAVAHHRGDFAFAVGVDDDERIFDAPVGGIGDVGDPRQAVELDVVAARAAAKLLQREPPQRCHRGETGGKGFDCVARALEQKRNLLRACRLLRPGLRAGAGFGEMLQAALFDFVQAVAHRGGQRRAPVRVVL